MYEEKRIPMIAFSIVWYTALSNHGWLSHTWNTTQLQTYNFTRYLNITYFVKIKRETHSEKSGSAGVLTQDFLIASQMLYHLSYWNQVGEYHFIDNVYYQGQANSAVCLSLLGTYIHSNMLLCMGPVRRNCSYQSTSKEVLTAHA